MTDHAERWSREAADIRARWEHGHDELTSGCALCNGEFEEVMRWTRANPLCAEDPRQ